MDQVSLAEKRFEARFPQGTDAEFRASWLRAWLWTAKQLQKAASSYRRDESKLVSLLAGHPTVEGLGADLWSYPDDPRVTWRLIRALCEAKRKVGPTVAAHYNLQALAYDGRLEAVIAGEIHIWRSQRASLAMAAE